MGHLGPVRPGHPILGIVCGLRSEVRRAERALGSQVGQARIVASGSSSDRTADLARTLGTEGVKALVSFGIGGGLDPSLKVGDVVRATRVASPAGRFGTPGGPLVWGSDRIVGDPQAKADLHARTGAVLVDMESHAVAMAAQAAGLPFIILRAVSDDARTALPDGLNSAVAPDGSSRLVPILAWLIRHPSRLPKLIELGRNTERALDAVERVGQAELPALLRRFDAT